MLKRHEQDFKVDVYGNGKTLIYDYSTNFKELRRWINYSPRHRSTLANTWNAMSTDLIWNENVSVKKPNKLFKRRKQVFNRDEVI
jgi:hypothetical protein